MLFDAGDALERVIDLFGEAGAVVGLFSVVCELCTQGL